MINSLSYGSWSVISSFFGDPSTVFNVISVSKNLHNVFSFEGMFFCENVTFSFWPFGEEGRIVKWLTNGKRIPFVVNLTIGPLDFLQRRLASKKNYLEKTNHLSLIFNGIPSHDNGIMSLLFNKKFHRLKRLEINSYFGNKFRISPSVFINSNIEALTIVHPYCLEEKETLMVCMSKMKHLKSLKLRKWRYVHQKKTTFSFHSLDEEESLDHLEELVLDIHTDSEAEIQLLSKGRSIASKITKLKSLKLNYGKGHMVRYYPVEEHCVFGNEIIQKSSRTLENLCIIDRHFNDTVKDFDFVFQDCKNLKSLSICHSRLFIGTFFQYLTQTLTKLYLEKSIPGNVDSNNMLPKYCVTGDNNLVNLRSLGLVSCFFFDNATFQEYTHLKHIFLRNCCRDLSMIGFKLFEKLKTFRVINSSTFTDMDKDFVIQLLKNNPKLDHVYMSQCRRSFNECPENCNHHHERFLGWKNAFFGGESGKFSLCQRIKLTRSLMLDPKNENIRPKLVKLNNWSSMWYVPNPNLKRSNEEKKGGYLSGCYEENFPYLKCSCTSRRDSFMYSIHKKCKKCGEVYCKQCVKRCSAYRYCDEKLRETECWKEFCSKCGYGCRNCEKVFCNSICLYNHLKNIHEKERPRIMRRRRSNSEPKRSKKSERMVELKEYFRIYSLDDDGINSFFKK